MSNTPHTSADRKEAEELITLLEADKKPSGPVRKEIMDLAREIALTLPKSQSEKVRWALQSLNQEIRSETPQEVRNLFLWTSSELMQVAPDIANSIIEERLKTWKWPSLTSEQRINIKMAIIARISEGDFLRNILARVDGGISSLTQWLKDIFSPGKIESLAKDLLTWSKKASGRDSIEETITVEVTKMVDVWLGEIQKAHESVPPPQLYEELLKDREALSTYTYGADIAKLLGKNQWNQKAFEERVQKKLQSIDARLTGMEERKESIFDILAKIPEIGSDKIIESIKWLFSIPIFSTFARWFLGLKGNQDPIDFIKKDVSERRSITLLQSFWKSGKNRNAIPLLSEIDLSPLKHRELRPFFRKMREKWVDTSHDDFWKKVFHDGKITLEKDGKEEIIKFPRWEPWNETLTSLLMKLNDTPQSQKNGAPGTQPSWETTRPETTEKPADRVSLIKKWLEQATSLPFRVGDELVSFESWELCFWNAKYKLEWVGMLTVAIENLSLQGSAVILSHRFGKSEVSKSEVIEVLPEILALGPGGKTELRWDDWTLRITRSA